jgi:hypothetical protein
MSRFATVAGVSLDVALCVQPSRPRLFRLQKRRRQQVGASWMAPGTNDGVESGVGRWGLGVGRSALAGAQGGEV